MGNPQPRRRRHAQCRAHEIRPPHLIHPLKAPVGVFLLRGLFFAKIQRHGGNRAKNDPGTPTAEFRVVRRNRARFFRPQREEKVSECQRVPCMAPGGTKAQGLLLLSVSSVYSVGITHLPCISLRNTARRRQSAWCFPLQRWSSADRERLKDMRADRSIPNHQRMQPAGNADVLSHGQKRAGGGENHEIVRRPVGIDRQAGKHSDVGV